jgi:hypothetical protein
MDDKPNRIVAIWNEVDEALYEIFGDVWAFGKFIIAIAIITGLLNLLN